MTLFVNSRLNLLVALIVSVGLMAGGHFNRFQPVRRLRVLQKASLQKVMRVILY